MDVQYSRSAAVTPAFALIAEGWCELVAEGQTSDFDGTCPVTAASELFYQRSADGDPVGVLAFSHDTVANVFRVQLSYVEPSSRQKNVFTELFAALVALARERAVRLIYADASAENAAGNLTLSALKAVPITVSYEFVVSTTG
jgi:GNAT superfamily N-acetyltransferase